MLKLVYHLLAAGHFWFGCYYDWKYIKIPAEVHRHGDNFETFGKLKFLTYWNAVLQAVFFTLCVLDDLFGREETKTTKANLLTKLKHKILPTLAFPLSMFVALTFWGIYLVDRELIFPRGLDKFFPSWLNHLMHTNIVIFILIELATSFRKYPSRKSGITTLTIFMAIYLLWIHVVYVYSGFWVYPILQVLNLPLRIVFFAVLISLAISLYVVGEKLNNLVWAKRLNKQAKRK